MFLIILTVYAALIIAFVIGWQRIPVFSPEKHPNPLCRVSVIIPCRNEEIHLPTLLDGLKNQFLHPYEIIFVDDNSTDNTAGILSEFCAQFSDIHLIQNTGTGKKQALATGISYATGELIVTTDADCVPHDSWIYNIASFYQTYKSDLIICPVAMRANDTFFQQLQALEFTSLVASGAGAVGAGMPIMCNGANLAFTKEIWQKCRNDLKTSELSGDDMFLLHSVKKHRGKIDFLKSTSAVVFTLPTPNLKLFVRQRTRWTGKSVLYTDFATLFTAFVVFGISLAQITALFTDVRVFLFLFVGKFAIDLLFAKSTFAFFSQKSTFLNLLLLSVIYPFYIIFTVVLAAFRNKNQW